MRALLLLALALPGVASAQATLTGTSAGPKFPNASVPTNGRVCLNDPTNTVCLYYDGVNSHFTNSNLINDNASFIGPVQASTVNATGANSLTLSGAASMVDDATAIGAIVRSSINMTNAAAKVCSFRNLNTEVAYIGRDGYIASTTPEALVTVNVNAQLAAGATIYGGLRLPPKANTVTAVGFYVSNASSGAGTTTFRVSDGTNNCDFAVDCAAGVTIATGGKYQATTSGTCTFAASAALVVSSNASTCGTTRPTLLNLTVFGSWQ